MDNKKIIILVIILLVVAAAVAVMLINMVNYEKIEITPNGTTIEVPEGQTKYKGDYEGIKLWSWNNGILITHNSHEDNLIQTSGIGFNALNEVIKNGEHQTIDGYDCYVINADDLFEIHIFEIIKINYKGKFYCIPLSNETTQDNLIICCNDRDMALHMAKSVEYKKVYPDDDTSAIDEVTGGLKSKAEGYINNTDWEGLKSKAEGYINNTDWESAKAQIEDQAGDYLSGSPIKF